MVAKHTGPREGSRAHRALKSLHEHGDMYEAAWMIKAAYDRSPLEFHRSVVQPLLAWGLIQENGVSYRVTRAGRALLGVPEVMEAARVVTPGTYVPPMGRPLSAKNRPGVRVMRPGALDFRDIPSRMGEQVVQYGAKAAA